MLLISYHLSSLICHFPQKQASAESAPDYAIQLMKMGPRDTYLCFIPPSIERESPPPEETITEITPSHSWSLLQPLDGTCLYVCDVSPPFSGYMTADGHLSIAKDGSLTHTATIRMSANSEK